MSDTTEVQSNLVRVRMEKKGVKSVAALARALGIANQTKLGLLIAGVCGPVTKSGTWKVDVVRMATYFGCSPEKLFPWVKLERQKKRRCACGNTCGLCA